MSKVDCSRATRGVRGATQAGLCAGRCVRGLPCTIWTERMASRTSTSGLSTPSAATGHSRIGGGGQRITAGRNSGDIQMTRHRSQAVASICSGDRSTCRLTPNRPKFCMTISLPRGPALRKNWRQKRSSSSTPNSSPVGSSGLRPVPRNDILICRQQGLPGLPWCAGVPVRRACRTGTVPLAVELIEGHGAGGEREPGRNARMPPGSRTGLRDGRTAGRVPADPGRSGAGRRTPARNHRVGRGSGRRPDARERRGGAGRCGPASPGYRRVRLPGASRPVVPSR